MKCLPSLRCPTPNAAHRNRNTHTSVYLPRHRPDVTDNLRAAIVLILSATWTATPSGAPVAGLTECAPSTIYRAVQPCRSGEGSAKFVSIYRGLNVHGDVQGARRNRMSGVRPRLTSHGERLVAFPLNWHSAECLE